MQIISIFFAIHLALAGECIHSNTAGVILVPLVSVDSTLMGIMYVGTPPQEISVVFDTGTSDTVIYSSSFQKNESTSFSSLDEKFSVIYGSGEVNGTWAKEYLQVNSKTSIDGLQFGLGESSHSGVSQHALIGIGLPKFETCYTSSFGVASTFRTTYFPSEPPYMYENFPQRLKNQGAIGKCMYSLYYFDKFAQGEYVFGGVDTAKYETLISVPIIQATTGDWTDYVEASLLAVGLDSINVVLKKEVQMATPKNFPALIDSGTYPIVAPTDVIENLIIILNGTYDDSSYEIAYRCNNEIFLSFSFGGETVKVNVDSMSVADDGVCYFMVIPSPDEYIILGMTFLRNVYTAWDLGSMEISFGNSIDISDSRIVAVGDGESLPRSHKVKNYNSTFKYSASNLYELKPKSITG